MQSEMLSLGFAPQPGQEKGKRFTKESPNEIMRRLIFPYLLFLGGFGRPSDMPAARGG